MRLTNNFLINCFLISIVFVCITGCNPADKQTVQKDIATKDSFDWIKTARVFLLDAYYPPFTPELEYDADLLSETVADMHGNVVRIGTMGMYATIQGIRFSTHPDQGDRDILAETIDA